MGTNMQPIYIASGWFNEEQRCDLFTIEYMLTCFDLPFFSPSKEAICPAISDPAERNKVFGANLQAIDDAEYVIVNTRDKDLGTIFEAGVAYAWAKKIIYCAFGLKGQFNLMLAQSGCRVCTSFSDLQVVLEELARTGTLEDKQYTGSIE